MASRGVAMMGHYFDRIFSDLFTLFTLLSLDEGLRSCRSLPSRSGMESVKPSGLGMPARSPVAPWASVALQKAQVVLPRAPLDRVPGLSEEDAMKKTANTANDVIYAYQFLLEIGLQRGVCQSDSVLSRAQVDNLLPSVSSITLATQLTKMSSE